VEGGREVHEQFWKPLLYTFPSSFMALHMEVELSSYLKAEHLT
jgi:hypothetical protein